MRETDDFLSPPRRGGVARSAGVVALSHNMNHPVRNRVRDCVQPLLVEEGRREAYDSLPPTEHGKRGWRAELELRYERRGARTVLAERRVLGFIQGRLGPNRVGPGGILQPFADLLKFILKEDIVPDKSTRFVYFLAPVIATMAALMTMIVYPFGPETRIPFTDISLPLVIARFDVGLLYVLGITSIGVYGIALAGWSSNNKYSLMGGLRASAQMISYEIAMGLSVMGVLMVYGTLELQEIARGQGALIRDMLPSWLGSLEPVIGWLPAWGIFLQPLAFLLFFTSAVAETKRIPFDLPEGESELVAGYHVEYSGGKFLMFFAGEFAEVVTAAALVTTLFFGAWQVPYLMRDGFHLPSGGAWLLPHYAVVALQVGAFTVKVLFFCWLQILLRWSVPRFRYDQVMRLGWKIMLPLALINVALTALVILAAQRG